VISNGTLSQNKINERYFLNASRTFIFDHMTKKERELYKKCLGYRILNKWNYYYFIIPKLTVKRFRNAPMAIAWAIVLDSHPQLPAQEPRPRVIPIEPRFAVSANSITPNKYLSRVAP
jgi:hypothetical protein